LFECGVYFGKLGVEVEELDGDGVVFGVQGFFVGEGGVVEGGEVLGFGDEGGVVVLFEDEGG
jgi:hypothetical protein